MHAEEIDFVICFYLGANPPSVFYAEGREILLLIAQNGKPKTFHNCSTLSPEVGHRIYQRRTKFETGFRDLKILMNVDKFPK